MPEQLRFPAAYMRGGTSKGLFFQGAVLPGEQAERDRVLVRALGGGDPYRKQIDGLGGATSSTSKAVVVSRSGRPGFDVDYLFAQVGVETAVVDWRGSCGNLAAAVGPFAIEEGLVVATDPLTTVRIWQVNTGTEIVAHVPSRDGMPLVAGGFRIDGIPHPGAEIRLDFIEPGGGICGRLLPSGNPVDRLAVDGLGSVDATLLDAGNPCVFVAAEALGLRGSELPDAINSDPGLLNRLEAVRSAGAVAMGLAASAAEATVERPAVPKLALLARPEGYPTTAGGLIEAGDFDVLVRMVSMGRIHHTIPGTGAVALAACCALPASVAAGLIGPASARGRIRLGHPAGVVEVEAELVPDPDPDSGGWRARRVSLGRTARRLMEGWVLVPSR